MSRDLLEAASWALLGGGGITFYSRFCCLKISH